MEHETTDPRRLVALGASNLTRGFGSLVADARWRFGPQVEVWAALGHGRSYGVASRVLVRTLPGILESGLWRELSARPAVPTRALLTDVGNDILYGFPPARILAWVEECADRLARLGSELVLTDLPLASIGRLSPARFVAFRTLLFPGCRLGLSDVLEAAADVCAGLESLARARGARFVRLRREWYGFDPIHVRPSVWRSAWHEILTGESAAGSLAAPVSLSESVALYALPPERQWWFGLRRDVTQTGRRLPRGGRVWLF